MSSDYLPPDAFIPTKDLTCPTCGSDLVQPGDGVPVWVCSSRTCRYARKWP